MQNRAQRRAAEHAARKLAYKEKQQSQIHNRAADALNEARSVLSEAQLLANRTNAELSTGPTTPQGRARSSKNAITHALTGSTVLLPTDDTAEYERQLHLYFDHYQPATAEEQALVQSVVDSHWRISRIKRLETGILLRGHTEFEGKFDDQPEHRRSQLIETETYLKYEKSFRNLQIQECRLTRRIEKDKLELTRLQSARKLKEALQPPLPETENGFDFSTEPDPENGFDFSFAETQPLPPSETGDAGTASSTMEK